MAQGSRDQSITMVCSMFSDFPVYRCRNTARAASAFTPPCAVPAINPREVSTSSACDHMCSSAGSLKTMLTVVPSSFQNLVRLKDRTGGGVVWHVLNRPALLGRPRGRHRNLPQHDGRHTAHQVVCLQKPLFSGFTVSNRYRSE